MHEIFDQWILKKVCKFQVIFLSFWSLTVNSAELKVLVLKDGSRPYAENTSGDVLSTFNRAVLGQLLLSTSNYELQAGLLKGWKWHKSDGSYDLFLRDDVNFHDGSKVTSEDLEFALLRGFFSKNQSFYSIYLGNIVGVDKVKPGSQYRSGLVEGVKITGPLTVNVKLKSPNPSFLYSLTRPYFSFAKRSAMNDDLVSWKRWPIGAGSYKIEDEDADKIDLVKQKNINDIGINRISLFKKLNPKIKYDVSFLPLDQKMEIMNTKNPSAIFTLYFTNQNMLSSNSNFRNAIRFGINRNEIIDGDSVLRPAYEFLSSSFWHNDESIDVRYDLEKAKSYFAKVPASLKKKVWRIPVFSFGELSADAIRRTSIMKKQFASFGFKTEYYASSEKFLSKAVASAAPFSYSGRICNNVDPLLMFASFKTDSAYKYNNAQNDQKYDQLYEAAEKAITTDERLKTLRELSKYTIDHNFMIPVFEENQKYYYNSATVGSFGNQTNAITLFLNEISFK